MKVVIAGGGTAGHVNPAIALAHALEGDEVSFIGTAGGAESRLVPAAGFPSEVIDVRGFDRSRPLSLAATGFRALGAVAASRKLLKRLAPDVVVGMGGYVSLPVCLAAKARGIPVVIHEQNIVFGLANRVCRRFAARIAVSFEETLVDVKSKGAFVGNPVSPSMVTIDPAEERRRGFERFELDPARKTLLVFGGSQGAKRINDAAGGLVMLWRDRPDLQVLHISGRRWEPSTELQPGRLIYRRVEFVDRMTEAYAVANLALCRGGATTVAELCVMGLPSIVVPYPYHRDRQQERHGRVLERAGAAKVLLDDDTTTESVDREAGSLLADAERLARMASSARALGRPQAADDLAAVVRSAA